MEYQMTFYFFENATAETLSHETLWGADYEDTMAYFRERHPFARLQYAEEPESAYPIEDFEPDYDIEMGFDPYEGDYTFDC